MIRGLDKIKNIEEYENAKKGLEFCISEYKWISESKNPSKEIEEEIKVCSDKLTKDMDKEEEFKLLNKIHLLTTKHIAILSGKYKSALKSNINAFVLMLEQFEASNQKMKFADLVRGIISGNPETKEYMKKKYMFTFANMYGTTPAPVSLDVESMDDILEYMDKHYDLVDIDLSDRKANEEELGLTVFEEPVVGVKAVLLKSIGNTVDKTIESYSKEKPTKEETKIAVKKSEVIKEHEYDKKINKEHEYSKSKGEIDI